MNGKHLDWNLIHGKCNEWYLLQIIAIILLAGQSFLVFFLQFWNCGVYTVFLYKIVSIDEKYLSSYENLLSVKWRYDCKLSFSPGEMCCRKDK